MEPTPIHLLQRGEALVFLLTAVLSTYLLITTYLSPKSVVLNLDLIKNHIDKNIFAGATIQNHSFAT